MARKATTVLPLPTSPPAGCRPRRLSRGRPHPPIAGKLLRQPERQRRQHQRRWPSPGDVPGELRG
jgi:hypothetical protein